MSRRPVRSTLMIAALLAHGAVLSADGDPAPPVLQRFFETRDSAPRQYRALRRFEARNDKLDKSAWMTVWTEADHSGFRYQVVGKGGSGYIHSKVFIQALETERRMWAEGTAVRAAITEDNYRFAPCDAPEAALTCVTLEPRRKDVVLVAGSMFLDSHTGDLVRVEGSLAKTPSFWTRRVDILRRYERIGGVRVPVAVESTASVRVAGASTMTITYEYERINDIQVGAPLAAPGAQVAAR